jgi:hypothetical protein
MSKLVISLHGSMLAISIWRPAILRPAAAVVFAEEVFERERSALWRRDAQGRGAGAGCLADRAAEASAVALSLSQIEGRVLWIA